jgi:hypothetical protein
VVDHELCDWLESRIGGQYEAPRMRVVICDKAGVSAKAPTLAKPGKVNVCEHQPEAADLV